VGTSQIQAFLATKIVVEGRQVDACILGDLPGRCALEAVISECLQRNFENPSPGFFTLLIAIDRRLRDAWKLFRSNF
jgi:hypothetical protein